MPTSNQNLKKISFYKNFLEITKVRLSVSVLFSSIAGYFLGADVVNFTELILLCVGGYAMVGASNVYNQIIEKDLDALMERTKKRPLPSGNMTVNTAFTIAVVLTVIGIVSLYIINPITAMFGAISIFMYVSLYTPLKTKTSLSVFVGAIPGAIPFMLGWVAVTNQFSIETGILFMIQFFWQFPHFWAIGWVSHDDYLKGGFKMLPSGKRDNSTAFQIVFYTIWMILISTLPYFSFTGDLSIGLYSLVLILASGLFMLFQAIRLMKYKDKQNAIRLMYTSIFYLSFIQIIFVLDKFLS